MVVGLSLLTCGATAVVSNIVEAIGVDSKTACIISNSIDIVAGAALLATPAAGVGAGMIGSGVAGLAGGSISEAIGGSYEFGSAIGNMVGGILGGSIYKGIGSSSAKAVQSIGSPFNANASTQIGVDPYTLKISRGLNPKKLAIVRSQVKKIRNVRRYSSNARWHDNRWESSSCYSTIA